MEFRKEAKAKYEAEGVDALVNFATEKILESYKNGIVAGKVVGDKKFTPKWAKLK